MQLADTVSCREFVELASDYLELELAPRAAARLDAHLAACDGCATYLEQVTATVGALRALPPEPAPESLHRVIAAALTAELAK